MRARLQRGGAIIYALVAACGEDPAPIDPADGGIAQLDAAPPRVIAPPAPPAPPELDEAALAVALPSFAPCPSGWREARTSTRSDAATYCDPWPEGGQKDCAAGEAHFAGEPDCAPIGTPCDPSNPFAVNLPLDDVVYVDQLSPPGGDGARARPFAILEDAIAEAPPSSVIALAKGTYTGDLTPPPGVRVIGACVNETIIEGGIELAFNQSGVANLAVHARGDGLYVGAAMTFADDLLIFGSGGDGVVISGGLVAHTLVVRDSGIAGIRRPRGGLWLSRAIVERARGAGMLIAGAGGTASISDVVITGVEPTQDGIAGHGMQIIGGAHAELERVVFERERSAGLVVAELGTSAIATDLVVRDMIGGDTTRQAGLGIAVDGGARATLARVLVERVAFAGIESTDGSFDLTQAIVRDVRDHPTEGSGRGLRLVQNELTADRVLIERTRFEAIGMYRGSVARFEDLTVRDTTTSRDHSGFGFYAQDNSRAEILRGAFSRHRSAAVAASEATLSLTEVAIRDGRSDYNINGNEVIVRSWGRGLVAAAADVEMVRCLVENAVAGGVYSVPIESEHAARLHLEDVVVRNTTALADALQGYGVLADGIADVHLARVALEGNHTAALFLNGAALSATIEDLTISDTEPSEAIAGGAGGYGLFSDTGASVRVERAVVERSTTGEILIGDGVTFTGADIVVETTRDIIIGNNGYGIAAFIAANAELARVRVEDNFLAGVITLGEGAFIRLEDTVVEDVELDNCDAPECLVQSSAVGIAALQRGRIEARRFRVARSAVAGVQVASGGEMDLYDGVITENPIGANVQVEGFDTARLSRDVDYIDNAVDLDATSQPAPEIEKPTL